MDKFNLVIDKLNNCFKKKLRKRKIISHELWEDLDSYIILF